MLASGRFPPNCVWLLSSDESMSCILQVVMHGFGFFILGLIVTSKGQEPILDKGRCQSAGHCSWQ